MQQHDRENGFWNDTKQVELKIRGKQKDDMRCSPRRLSNTPPLGNPEKLGNRTFEVLDGVEKQDLSLSDT